MYKSLYMGICSAIALSMLSTTALADGVLLPNDHAPIGVSGDHTHAAGKWMVGYKYDYTHFSGNKEGTSSLTPANLMSRYGDVTLNMTMEMHMFEIMYGVNENFTLMVMPQYMKMDMLHASSHGGGHMHDHEAEGFGDTEVTGLYSFYTSNDGSLKQKALLNLGVSVPTGQTDVKYTDHHGNIRNMPYNMQFGSGTFDPILGATYTASSKDWTWGAQTMNYIRVGKNDEGYRQGNKYTATAWVSRNVTDFASLSFRVEGEAWENVSGHDKTFSVTTIAGADPKGQAGERLFSYVGVNLLGGEKLAHQRLAVEFGMPFYERFDGPQPETDYRLNAGWQLAF